MKLCLLSLVCVLAVAWSAPHVDNFSEDLLSDLEELENENAHKYQSKCNGLVGADTATIVKAAHLARAVYTKDSFSKEVGPQGLKMAFYMQDGPDDLDFGEADPVGSNRPWVVFGGSESTDDWKINFDLWMVGAEAGISGKVHRGFSRQWSHARSEVTSFMKEHERAGRKSVFFTGHSLGGAVATVAAAEMQKRFPGMSVNLITFGAPKVGDDDYATSVNQLLKGRVSRNENAGDPVPCIPPHIKYFAPYSGELDGCNLYTPGKGFENGRERAKGCVMNLNNLKVSHHSMDEYISNFGKC
jgi:hypothetical protein